MPNPACSGHGYAVRQPRRFQAKKLSPAKLLDKYAVPLTPSLGVRSQEIVCRVRKRNEKGSIMNDKVFFERLMKGLQKTKDIYELDNLHDAFIVWYAENVLQMEGEEARERIVADAHAEGVDAVFMDDSNGRVVFLQAKTVREFSKTQNNLPENDIKATLTGMRLLLQGEYKGKITPELENLVDEYHDKANTGDYVTEIVFLTLKQGPLDTKFIDDFKKDFENVHVKVVDFAILKDFYEDEYLSKLSPPPKKVTFQIITDISKKEFPYRSFVFTVKARDIAKFYSDYGEIVFQKNVRYFLGMRARNINEQIYQTATDKDRAHKFWYFNNGITIVCRQVGKTPSGKVAILQQPQVINGAQTTYALYKAYEAGALQEEAEVLLRVIETSDPSLVEEITLYTNSQNAIRTRDLCSNDLIQIRIQKVISEYGYFYERKRGEVDALYPTLKEKKKVLGKNYRDKVISNEKAAQAFVALYLGYPAWAKSEKKRIFVKGENGFYFRIFNEKDEILPEKMLFAWILLRYIEKKKREFRQKFKNNSNQDELYKKDFILHSEYFVLNLFADFLHNEGYDINNREKVMELIQKIEQEDTLIETIYNQIIEEMTKYIQDLREEPGYYHNKFFKSERSIGRVRDFFRKDFEFIST